MDEDGFVIRNQARLVAQGFCQLEGLDHDETFSPVARLKQFVCFWLLRLSKTSKSTKLMLRLPFYKEIFNKKFFLNNLQGSHIILAQVYVEDIIFRSTIEKQISKFVEVMANKFEMSMMGELAFFFDMLQKYGFFDCKLAKTMMSSSTSIGIDPSGTDVNLTLFCGMTGSVIYLIAIRPDIMLWNPHDSEFKLVGSIDSDHGGCGINLKSTS
ncbi:uncharacterized protein LOC111915623 [Lactuca sativa]|uniref:uncharacterized protein LOC111915623 n=1 Tax=Lactuca sativa TaxID=4236 RepID=UPI000CD81270|nr:uncharacterized protein LOC111915623 [Lactuca sativa]